MTTSEANDLIERLRPEVGLVKVVDVGAHWNGAEELAYRTLVKREMAEVVGFEPNTEECAKLNALGMKNHAYLPLAIGDGTSQTFHVTRFGQASSLRRPDRRWSERFTDLDEGLEVVAEYSISTKRLDDVPEARSADFIKLDVQGAELTILEHAPEVLAGALVVHTEVEFLPLYEGQPLFSEVELHLRQAGFQFHRFDGLACRAFRPLKFKSKDPTLRGQMLWADAVFVRNVLDLDALTTKQLLKLAVIVGSVYGSRDLSLLALQAAEEKGGPKVRDDYSVALTGSVKERVKLR